MAASSNTTCTSTDLKRTLCLCGETCEDGKMKPVLPGMSDSEPQFHPYCEIGVNMKDESCTSYKQKSFKSTVQRHFVKGRLFNLVNDFLKSIDEEKQAQQDLIKSFAQVREITAPLRKAKENQSIVLKRRKQRSNVPLLDQIEQKRQNNDNNNERNTNIRVFNAESETSSEIKIDLSARRKETTDTYQLNPERQKDKQFLSDATVFKNGQGNTLTKRRRSLSFAPGFFEKISVMKYFMNGNNIREIDKLVLESVDESTESSISFGQKRKKEKTEQVKCKMDHAKSIIHNTSKQYGVIVEVEPLSETNDADIQQYFEKSNELVRDHTLNIRASDQESYKLQPKSTNPKLPVNLTNLDSIAEMSHESFNAINDCKDWTPLKSQQSKAQCERNNDVSLWSFHQKNDNGDKSQIALASSKTKRRVVSSLGSSKVYRKNNLIHLRNTKKTKSVSQKAQKRTLTLNILDVYEENADLQKRDKHSPRQNNRNNCSMPYTTKKRTNLKSSKGPQILDPCTTELKGEVEDAFELNRSTSFSPYESLVSGNASESETYFQMLRNSQRDKLYKKPERVLWYNLDITEGCYKVCNRSSAEENYYSGSHTRLPEAWNVPISEAIKNIKGTRAIPQIRQLNETIPREQRVGHLYKSLKKERCKSALCD